MNTARSHRVYTRTRWSDDWVLQENLFADQVAFRAAPSISEAMLYFNYGRIVQYAGVTWGDVPAKSLNDTYVKIEIDQFGGAIRKWYGVVKETLTDPRGGDGTYGGKQRFHAFGMEYFLDRVQVDTSFVKDSSDNDYMIRRAIAFNMGQGDEKRGRYVPNMSTVAGDKDAFVFTNQLDDAQPWTAYSIVDYLLTYHRPKDDVDDDAMIFRLDPDHALQLFSLQWWKITMPYQGRTVKEILDSIMSRQRLMSYSVTVNADNEVIVTPFTFTEVDIDLPAGNTIYANDAQTTWNFNTDALIAGAMVVRDTQGTFERVIARGERLGVVWTMAYQASGNTMEKDWSSTLQTAYNDGSPSAAGTDYYQDVQLHRNYRNTDKFERVYRYFRVPLAWNGWSTDIWPVVINPDTVAITDLPPPADAFWRAGLTFEPYLPLRTDIDYETVVTDPSETTLAGSVPEYRRPFAVHYTSGTERAYYLDRAEAAQHYGARPETGDRGWGCTVRPQEHGFGLILDVQGAPQHAIAKDEFAATDDADAADWTAEIRWQNIHCTVFMHLDRFAEGAYPEFFALAEDVQRVLTIDVPNKRAHWIVPDTIIDVNADGTLKKSSGGWIEDDRDELQNIARIAYGWYSTERRALDITRHSLDCGFDVGDLLTTVGAGATLTTVNSVITQITFDLRGNAHSLQTQFAEFDMRGL